VEDRPADRAGLGAGPLTNAVDAAQFSGIRVIVSIYPFGSSVTPLTPADQADFAAFAADVATRFPVVHDFIVGNEPNLNRFWLPQFGPAGEDVAAPAYEQLLATTYDALKAVRPRATVYGGALAPRGVDKPNTGRDTHSPTAFIADLGAAYRASGRTLPIMDAFTFHPYPETSATGPDFPHPNSTAIGLADYDKLVGLLGAAFDGTAQRGSQLPILYDEFGIESQIPPAKASFYTGTEPTTTHPVDEAPRRGCTSRRWR
jgi:Cellulase (glycosyl hydrolase family 5).